ncbi:unnamed protein product [Albugo candida]|uniref:Uncharacterized protein n=1 Tax=Albugo candida TaxID=65357 RepID=A0A024FYR7_9STRA|nr:unnamed protein product [Albugo candida]|eukprot:CCI11814.1 unnamed protein product [Albugo candida]
MAETIATSLPIFGPGSIYYRDVKSSSTNGAVIEERPLLRVSIDEKDLFSDFDAVKVARNGQSLQGNNVKMEVVTVIKALHGFEQQSD